VILYFGLPTQQIEQQVTRTRQNGEHIVLSAAKSGAAEQN